jgi:uridine kinase
MDTQNSIQLVSPRPTVEVILPDGRVLCGPRNTQVGLFLSHLPEWETPPIVGAVINGELRELTYPIDMDGRVRPITMSDADGARIYRRSLTFLLEAAFKDLFPTASLSIDHSIASGGFFCRVGDRPPFTLEELKILETHMEALVKADLPFARQQIPLSEAVAYFQQTGEVEKVLLLKYRTKDHLILYSLGKFRDYHHGYMVPSTGYLKWFALMPFGEGFILRFPRRQAPTRLLPTPESPKMLATFRQYGQWLSRLGIESVGALNDTIQAGRIREIILISEALHEQKIAEIASQILEHSKESRIILIAGPSSSGKTTFSKRLAVQLLAQGLDPYPMEMDNYFVNRENTPKDEKGQFDYEALDALNTKLLTDHLRC